MWFVSEAHGKYDFSRHIKSSYFPHHYAINIYHCKEIEHVWIFKILCNALCLVIRIIDLNGSCGSHKLKKNNDQSGYGVFKRSHIV